MVIAIMIKKVDSDGSLSLCIIHYQWLISMFFKTFLSVKKTFPGISNCCWVWIKEHAANEQEVQQTMDSNFWADH